MNLLLEAMNGLGAVLLPVVAALLFEEFTFAGLVRLLLARRPLSGNSKGHHHQLAETHDDRIKVVAHSSGSITACCRIGNPVVRTVAAHPDHAQKNH